MKIAIFGQFYQNTTSQIIEKLFSFLNNNLVTTVVYEEFLNILSEEKLISKKNIVIGCVDLWQLQQTADLLIEKNYKIYHDGRSLQLYISL